MLSARSKPPAPHKTWLDLTLSLNGGTAPWQTWGREELVELRTRLAAAEKLIDAYERIVFGPEESTVLQARRDRLTFEGEWYAAKAATGAT